MRDTALNNGRKDEDHLRKLHLLQESRFEQELCLTNIFNFSNLSSNMRLITFCCAALLAFHAVPSSKAQEPPARLLTLQECIQMALEHNLDLQIERYNPRLLQYALDASYGYYDPTFSVTARRDERVDPGRVDPDTGLRPQSIEATTDRLIPGIRGALPTGLTYDIGADFRTSEFTESGRPGEAHDATVGINLRQPLLRDFWTDPGRTSIRMNRKNLNISELGFSFVVMDVVTRVQLAYYDLIFARENVKVQEMALRLSQRFLEESSRRLEVGVEAPLDQKQAESQVATTLADLISAQENLHRQENILKNLITDSFAEWADVILIPAETLREDPEPLDVRQSWTRALSQRPDYQAQLLDLERLDLLTRLRHNQLFPSLDLIGGYGRRGFDSQRFGGALSDIESGRSPNHYFGVILSMPLTRRAERSEHAAAKARRDQADLRVKRFEQDIIVEIDNAVRAVRSAYERIELRRLARVTAEDALFVEQRRLEAGTSRSFFVLNFQRDLTSARSAEIRALAEYNKALARLAFEQGTSLERNRIDIDLR
jgi:outer membrane protein